MSVRWKLAPLALLLLVGCEAIGVPNPACTVEGLVCSAGHALECTADGIALADDDCVARGEVCSDASGCVQCAAFGTESCVGQSWVTCSSTGTITARRDCFAEGLVCAGPGLGCATCAPGSRSCQGDAVVQCNSGGTGWDPAETCDAFAGMHCDLADGTCGDLCARAQDNHSYVGCDYWATSTSNAQLYSQSDEFEFAIVVSNPQAVPASLTIASPGGVPVSRVVPAGGVETIRLPWMLPMVTFAEVSPDNWARASLLVPDGAFHVESDVPVTVYQFNPLDFRVPLDCASEDTPADGECFSYTNDASLLLPTSVLTGDYIVVARASLLSRAVWRDARDQVLTSDGESESWSYLPGFVAIVGAEDRPVQVEVVASAFTESSGPDGAVARMQPGDSVTFTLGAGDVLELISAEPGHVCTGPEDSVTLNCGEGATPPCRQVDTYCDVGPQYDLTGTRIRADGRVAVFGGHDCAFVPSNRWACDHLEESLFPLQAWGTDVVVSITEPIRGEPNLIRIVSGAADNTIHFEPAVRADATLALGTFLEFEASQDFRVTSSGPITVGQFLVGQDYAGRGASGDGGIGDPSFSLAIPVEQYRSRYSFLAPGSFEQSWVNVSAEAGQSVLLDGVPVAGWRSVPQTRYQTARVQISGGAHTMTSDRNFGIVVYGFGRYTSYMYPGGLDLEVINLI